MSDIKTIFQEILDNDLLEDRREYCADDLALAYNLGMHDAYNLRLMIADYIDGGESSKLIEALAIEYIRHLFLSRAMAAAGRGAEEINYRLSLGLERDFAAEDIADYLGSDRAMSDDDLQCIYYAALEILGMA